MLLKSKHSLRLIVCLEIINMAVFQSFTQAWLSSFYSIKFAFNINKHGECPFFIRADSVRHGYYFITKFHSIYFMILFSCEAVMNRKSSSWCFSSHFPLSNYFSENASLFCCCKNIDAMEQECLYIEIFIKITSFVLDTFLKELRSILFLIVQINNKRIK